MENSNQNVCVKEPERLQGHPKLSIITPVYNAAETFEATIKSVDLQNYPFLEYIVVDGASSDGTLDIIHCNESRISRWISEPDDGLYHAMNKGVKMATGDLIGIIGADDVYMPGAFSRVAQTAINNPSATVIYGDALFQKQNGHIRQRAGERISKEADLYRMPAKHSSMFVRREAFEKHGGFNTQYRIVADHDHVYRLFVAGERFVYLRACLSKMRAGGVSDGHARLWEIGRMLMENKAPTWGWIRFIESAIISFSLGTVASFIEHTFPALLERFRTWNTERVKQNIRARATEYEKVDQEVT